MLVSKEFCDTSSICPEFIRIKVIAIKLSLYIGDLGCQIISEIII